MFPRDTDHIHMKLREVILMVIFILLHGMSILVRLANEAGHQWSILLLKLKDYHVMVDTRMGNISNSKYLEMAKLGYNHCQAIHQLEWSQFQKWYAHLKVEERFHTRLLWSYYLPAASIFEPDLDGGFGSMSTVFQVLAAPFVS